MGGNLFADGNTCSGSAQSKKPVQSSVNPKLVMETLRTALCLESDADVLRRVVALKFDGYDPQDDHWRHAVESDIARYQHDGTLAEYVFALYHEHISANN